MNYRTNSLQSWLTTIPLMEHDFCLNKTTFWDSIHIHYDTPLKYLPSRCICGKIFNLEHALSCKKGDFSTLRHNELRDFTVNQLSEVVHDVRLEPQLKTSCRWNLSLQYFKYARELRDCKQLAFSDIKLFSLLAKCHNAKHLKSIIETEDGFFTPLVFACTGRISKEFGTF